MSGDFWPGQAVLSKCSKRLRVLSILEQFLLEIVRAGVAECECVENRLPNDCRILAVRYIGCEVQILLESGEFSEVPPGEIIPFICPQYRRVGCNDAVS